MHSADITIIHGDMRMSLGEIPESSVDVVITDPPYGQTSLEWDKWVSEWTIPILRVLKPSGSMWCFGTQRMFLDHADEFKEWSFAQDVIWEKQNGTGLFNDRFRRVHESSLHFYPKKVKWRDIYRETLYTNDAIARVVRKKVRPAHWIGATGESVYRSEDGGPRLMRSVMYARNEHSVAVHPTQKPVSILAPLVKYSCPPGGTVLDPFGGSGSTGIAARMLNRKSILIEANPEYVEVMRRRVNNDAPLFNLEI